MDNFLINGTGIIKPVMFGVECRFGGQFAEIVE